MCVNYHPDSPRVVIFSVAGAMGAVHGCSVYKPVGLHARCSCFLLRGILGSVLACDTASTYHPCGLTGVFVVSHDEHLITAVCDELWIIKDKKVHLSEGDFQDYKAGVLKEMAKKKIRGRRNYSYEDDE